MSWAKPIGASKFLERQRHIREAAANSSVQSVVKSWPKQAPQDKKRSKKALTKMHENESVHLVQMKVLQDFVRERYEAVCVFNCVPIQNTAKYVGKVSTLSAVPPIAVQFH